MTKIFLVIPITLILYASVPFFFFVPRTENDPHLMKKNVSLFVNVVGTFFATCLATGYQGNFVLISFF